MTTYGCVCTHTAKLFWSILFRCEYLFFVSFVFFGIMRNKFSCERQRKTTCTRFGVEYIYKSICKIFSSSFISKLYHTLYGFFIFRLLLLKRKKLSWPWFLKNIFWPHIYWRSGSSPFPCPLFFAALFSPPHSFFLFFHFFKPQL